jgi:aryl-alcohol dehydrogenase-like predicted oxidoreductase
MRFLLLGNSGLRVSQLCLGAMTFGEEWGWGSNKDESRKVFDAFVEAGGNFIDTADMYTGGTSEKMVGEFVASAGRERFVIATKYSFNSRRGDANAGGNHRKNMVQALEGSLKRLKMDYVDLYWVHAWDQMTPIEETMRALDDLVRAGKILYVGVSNFPAWLVSRANALAEWRGWSPIVAMQIEYSLIERTSDRELIPMAQALNIGLTSWSPLASGILSGKYSGRGEAEGERRLDKAAIVSVDERKLRIAEEVGKVASELGTTAARVALAWVCSKPGMIPIVGARKSSQLIDNLGCLSISLPEEQMKRLEQVSAIAEDYPTDFLNRPPIRDFLHGGTWDAIDRNK